MRTVSNREYYIDKDDVTDGGDLITDELEVTFEPDTSLPVILSKTPDGYSLRYAATDSNPINPRENCDYLGKMICLHRRYNLGDDHDYKHGDANGWFELLDLIEKTEGKILVSMPLYLFDHSGITMSTSKGRFQACDSAGWDWGQVGWIIALTKDVRKEFMVKKISKELEQKVTEILKSEVEEYNNYLTGEVYGIIEEKYDENFDIIDYDSCWGYIGSEYTKKVLKERI